MQADVNVGKWVRQGGWHPSPKKATDNVVGVTTGGIDKGKDKEDAGDDNRQGPTVGWPENGQKGGKIAPECGYVTVGDLNHGGVHEWSQNTDLNEGNLSEWSDRQEVARWSQKMALKGNDGGRNWV